VTGLLGTPAFVSGAHPTAVGQESHRGQDRQHRHNHAKLEKHGDTTRGCDCAGTGLVVHNPEECAPTVEYVFRTNPDRWPAGYPPKGRLVHWATPCDYSSTKEA